LTETFEAGGTDIFESWGYGWGCSAQIMWQVWSETGRKTKPSEVESGFFWMGY